MKFIHVRLCESLTRRMQDSSSSGLFHCAFHSSILKRSLPYSLSHFLQRYPERIKSLLGTRMLRLLGQNKLHLQRANRRERDRRHGLNGHDLSVQLQQPDASVPIERLPRLQH